MKRQTKWRFFEENQQKYKKNQNNIDYALVDTENKGENRKVLTYFSSS